MTVNTKVLLKGDIDPETAFEMALTALMSAAERTTPREEILVNPKKYMEGEDVAEYGETDEDMIYFNKLGYNSISTRMDQGLPGIVDVSWREGEEITDYYGKHRGDVMISWDTEYAYAEYAHGGNLDATALHSLALLNLRDALPKGVTMMWHNELSDEWHLGISTGALMEFNGAGLGVSQAFRDVIVPTIGIDLNRDL